MTLLLNEAGFFHNTSDSDRAKTIGLKVMDKEVLDLKGEPVSNDTRPSETTESEEVVEVDVESIKEQLRKAEEDRDKYKERVLGFSKKHPEKTLEEPKEEEEPEVKEESNWDEDSQRFQKQTLTQAEGIAKRVAKETIEATNERAAIDSFVEQYPEYQDSAEWKEIVSNYMPKNGKGSVKSILKDLERARVLRLHDKGDISKLAEEAEKRGKQKGYAEGVHAELTTSGGERTKTVGTKHTGSVTEGAKRLAERFRIDPKKLAQEDDSNRATINF